MFLYQVNYVGLVFYQFFFCCAFLSRQCDYCNVYCFKNLNPLTGEIEPFCLVEHNAIY